MSDDIVLVDDDPGTIQLLARILARSGTLRFATNGSDALRLTRESAPDLMLLDAEMPGMSGFQVCKAMKADAALVDVPVIFVTSHGEAAIEIAGFEMGAVDFIAKPVSAPLVLARVTIQLRLKRMADELRRIATIDAVTGIANRRRFDDKLEREWRRGRREGSSMALLMIDIDHFKLFNDRYGHPAGDACLRGVAQALACVSVRPADLVARYGGEEFAILLPQTAREGAEFVARSILGAIESIAIPHEASPTAGHVTVSIGVSSYDTASISWLPGTPDSRYTDELQTRATAQDLVRAADRALYSAKHRGRARAHLLDIADVDTPQMARDVSPRRRSGDAGARTTR
jgi:diguanylate cyclase (GGDEF)-like protein